MSAMGWQKDRIALAQQPIVALTGNCKACTAVQNDDPFGFVLVIPITRRHTGFEELSKYVLPFGKQAASERADE